MFVMTAANTTYISIAHRPTLAAFHEKHLALAPDGEGMRLVVAGVP
jgi:ABC-type uncharacterized transport system fused permease/ATPase subunit